MKKDIIRIMQVFYLICNEMLIRGTSSGFVLILEIFWKKTAVAEVDDSRLIVRLQMLLVATASLQKRVAVAVF